MVIQNIGEFLLWYDRVRERTRKVVHLIPPEYLERTWQEGKFTPGDLVRHIAGIERWLYAETVAGNPPKYHGCSADLAPGKEATITYFDEMHDQSVKIFSTLSPDDLLSPVSTINGHTITCWKWLRALAEHEIHHRGQIYLYLNQLKVVTPPLFGLTSEEVILSGEL